MHTHDPDIALNEEYYSKAYDEPEILNARYKSNFATK